jgi:hypothetical protein
MQSKSLLPIEYQQVEYIESTGTQYTKLDYILQENDEINLTFEFMGYFKIGDAYLFSLPEANVWAAYNYRTDRPERFYTRFGSLSSAFFENFPEKGSLTLRKNQLIMNGVYHVINEYTAISNSRFFLLGINSDYSKCKLFDFFVEENDIKKLHLIPCYRKSDGEIGLYDTINKKFYTNLGTGEFLKGPDV